MEACPKGIDAGKQLIITISTAASRDVSIVEMRERLGTSLNLEKQRVGEEAVEKWGNPSSPLHGLWPRYPQKDTEPGAEKKRQVWTCQGWKAESTVNKNHFYFVQHLEQTVSTSKRIATVAQKRMAITNSINEKAKQVTNAQLDAINSSVDSAVENGLQQVKQDDAMLFPNLLTDTAPDTSDDEESETAAPGTNPQTGTGVSGSVSCDNVIAMEQKVFHLEGQLTEAQRNFSEEVSRHSETRRTLQDAKERLRKMEHHLVQAKSRANDIVNSDVEAPRVPDETMLELSTKLAAAQNEIEEFQLIYDKQTRDFNEVTKALELTRNEKKSLRDELDQVTKALELECNEKKSLRDENTRLQHFIEANQARAHSPERDPFLDAFAQELRG